MAIVGKNVGSKPVVEASAVAVPTRSKAFRDELFGSSHFFTAIANYFSVTADVRTRKRRAGELRANGEFLDAIIEHIPAVVFVKRAEDLSYVLLNRAAELYFGKSRNELVGKTVFDFFTQEYAVQITARDREVLRTGQEEFRAEHPVDVPGVGARIVKTRRLPILDGEGQPRFLVGLIEDVTERREAEARIAYLAFHDTLTGLGNRTAFNEAIASAISAAVSTGTPMAILCLDIDRFKGINDAYGHPTGDALLREIARRLRVAAEGAFIARMGGDEFTLIVRERADNSSLTRTCQRIHELLEQPFCLESYNFETSTSIGVAICPDDGVNVETLLRKADTALYCAKAEGRGRTKFFESVMDARLHDLSALQSELRVAIANEELLLHYQPQIEIGGKVIGFEALVRWNHPQHGVIAPADFVPLAEETGLIVALGEWVLRTACREAASWQSSLSVAINVSAVQFREEDLAERVHAILLETGLPASRLELEITEGVLLANSSLSLSILRRLKNLGVRIAMDDFGTGYSSLSYLQSFPFDKIKIDRSFIANLSKQEQSAAIVRAVIGLGRSLRMPIIAEGVETEEQLAFLSREACNQMQGYLLGPPRPIAEYSEILETANLEFFTSARLPRAS